MELPRQSGSRENRWMHLLSEQRMIFVGFRLEDSPDRYLLNMSKKLRRK